MGLIRSFYLATNGDSRARNVTTSTQYQTVNIEDLESGDRYCERCKIYKCNL